MRKAIFILSCVLALAPAAFAQSAQGSGSGSGSGAGSGAAKAEQAKVERARLEQAKVEQAQIEQIKLEQAKVEQSSGPRFVRTLTNVQVELTITDQTGTAAPDKKTVSMVVSSGNWGKIRSAGNMQPPGQDHFVVDLNVDARPFVSVEGPIQLELTVAYAPVASPGTASQPVRGQPVKVTQSLTVVLQSGKPLVISQAADPVTDRKVIVEVKATVLK